MKKQQKKKKSKNQNNNRKSKQNKKKKMTEKYFLNFICLQITEAKLIYSFIFWII